MSNNAICNYDFRANEENFTVDSLKAIIDPICDKWTFQLEEGEESGYRHWQGRLHLKVKKRISYLINLFGGATMNYIRPTSSANMGNMFYVTKEETRVGGPWRNTDIYIPRDIREIYALNPWQNTALTTIVRVYHARWIDVIIDHRGHRGKTTFGRYAAVHGEARRIPFANDYATLVQIVQCMPKARCYIMDLPRALGKERLFQLWAAIETVKDGYSFDPRYSYKETYFDPPRFIIFTNKCPDMDMLSGDRWKLWQITDSLELEAYQPPAEFEGRPSIEEAF